MIAWVFTVKLRGLANVVWLRLRDSRRRAGLSNCRSRRYDETRALLDAVTPTVGPSRGRSKA